MTIDPKLAQQAFQYIGSPVRDPGLDATLQQLLAGGYLTQTNGDSEGGGRVFDWAQGVSQDPIGQALSGYGTTNTYATTQPTVNGIAGGVANPLNRLWNADQAVPATNGDGTKLLNPAMVKSTDFGNLTPVGNISHPQSTLANLFWKIAPLLPVGVAALMTGGAAAPLLSGLTDAGGTASGLGAGTFEGLGSGAASSFGATAGVPAWLSGIAPSTVQSGIKGAIGGLNSDNGQFNLASIFPSLISGGLQGAGLPQGLGGLGSLLTRKPDLSSGMTLAKLFGGGNGIGP